MLLLLLYLLLRLLEKLFINTPTLIMCYIYASHMDQKYPAGRKVL